MIVTGTHALQNQLWFPLSPSKCSNLKNGLAFLVGIVFVHNLPYYVQSCTKIRRRPAAVRPKFGNQHTSTSSTIAFSVRFPRERFCLPDAGLCFRNRSGHIAATGFRRFTTLILILLRCSSMLEEAV